MASWHRGIVTGSAIIVVAALCSCDAGAGQKGAPPQGTPVPFTVLVQTSGWTNLSVNRMAITTQQEWDEVWTGCHRPGSGPPQPDVDFATQIVIAAAMGTRATGGYSIVIEGLVERGGKLVAHVVETSPGAGCAVTPEVTAPATAILVKRHEVSVDFFDRRTVTECP